MPPPCSMSTETPIRAHRKWACARRTVPQSDRTGQHGYRTRRAQPWLARGRRVGATTQAVPQHPVRLGPSQRALDTCDCLRHGKLLLRFGGGKMTKLGWFALAVGASLIATPALAATQVAANNASPTFVGTFGPGTYTITGTGLIDLVGPVGSGFTVRPDGVPDSPITAPGYSYFNPSGSPIADGNYGPGGSSINIGALIGTFSTSPSSPADYFLVGYSKTFTISSSQSLYALVNETYYSNNGGEFSVSVAAVPEPSAWALMVVGIGVVGAAMRRRQLVRARISIA